MRNAELNLGLDKVISTKEKQEKKPKLLSNQNAWFASKRQRNRNVFDMKPTNPYVSNTTRCIKNLAGTRIASLG